MTVYNGMPYLRQAIESVLKQTLADFEFLIVDDASTDGSVDCIRSFSDPRIRLVCNDRNLGQADSLNKGLALARAPYIARLDQDDACLPNRLKTQANLLDVRPEVVVVGTRMAGIDSRGRQTVLLGRKLENYGTFVASLLLGLCPLCHPSVMFRQEVITAVGAYDASYSPAEDVDLWVRLALRRSQVMVIPEPLTLCRLHEGQQSVTKAEVQRKNVWRAQERFITTYCSPEDRGGVSLLLKTGGAFWREHGSKDRFVKVSQALNLMLDNLETGLGLSEQDRRALTGVLDRWLGPGIRIAPRISHWPSGLFFLTMSVLSPLLVPRVKPFLSRISRPMRQSWAAYQIRKPRLTFWKA